MARPILRKPRGGKPKAAASTEVAQPEVEEILSLHASLRRRLTQIRSSDLSLMVTFGERGDGEDVLVPLLDWQLFGVDLINFEDGDEPEGTGPELYSSLIALDNLAYLMNDMSFDILNAVKMVSAQAKGGINPLEDRMRYTANMLTQASIQLMSAAETIEGDLPTERASD